MKKILISDYDETFYLNDEDIKNNVNLLNKYQEKIELIIATGRSYYDFLKKKNKYNIICNYIILNHGATILYKDKIIYNVLIDNNIKKELVNFLNIRDNENVFCCSELESRVSINMDNLTKIHINYGDEILAKKIYGELNARYSKYINCFLVSKCKAIEIVAKSVDKKEAILKLIEQKKINKDNIYVVGNGDTDYEMLKYFNGFKMEFCSKKIESLEIETVKSVGDLIKKMIN